MGEALVAFRIGSRRALGCLRQEVRQPTGLLDLERDLCLAPQPIIHIHQELLLLRLQ